MTYDQAIMDGQNPSQSSSPSTPETIEVRGAEALSFSKADVRHNMVCCLILSAFWSTGWTDLMVALQPLLVFLGASNKMIGIISGVTAMTIFGTIVSPWITRRFRYKRRYLFVVNLIYLFPLALVGVAVAASGTLNLSKAGLLEVVLVGMLVHQFSAGFVTLPFQEFLAACFPMNVMGRFMGYSASLGSLTAIGASALGYWILGHYSQPMSFGYLFLLTWLICQVGYIAALFVRELPTPVEKSPAPWSRQMFKDFWDDKPFMRVQFFNSLGTITLFSIVGFVNVYGFKDLKMAAATSAIIQLVGQGVRIGAGSFIGHIIDKHKPHRVMPWLVLLLAVSLLPAILIRNSYGVYMSVGLSCLFGIGWSGCMGALTVGLPKPEHRAGNMTFAVLLAAIAGALGSLGMGWLCDLLAFRSVFIGLFIWGLVLAGAARFALRILDRPDPGS